MKVLPDREITAYALVKPGEHGVNLCVLFESEPAALRGADEYKKWFHENPSILEVEVSVALKRIVQVGDVGRRQG